MRNASRALIALTVTLVFAAACASAPESSGVSGLSEEDVEALFRPLPEVSNRLVHRGVSVAAPKGWVFENAWGAAPGGDPADSPAGVLFRFRDPDGVVSGSVQYVYVADAAEGNGRAFMETYLETRLDAPGDAVFSVPAGSSGRYGPAYAAFVQTGGEAGAAEMLTILFPLSPRVTDAHGILVEIVYPGGGDAGGREPGRAEAAAIAATVELPRVRGDMRMHRRITAHPAFPGFVDDSGHWQWATDLPGGMVLRKRSEEADLYLLLTETIPVDGTDPAAAAGPSVEYARGSWRWSLPVAVSPEDPYNRYVRIPPDPLTGLPAFSLSVTAPERRWSGTQAEAVDPPDDTLVAREMEVFLRENLVIP